VPVLVKLSPSVTEIEEIATAAAEGGADGLVLINTVRGIAIDRVTLRPLLGGGGGGLSGPAVKPVALHAVFHVFAATGLPIVGMGGVASGADACEFLAAGAVLVGIGTALFREPAIVEAAARELAEELDRRGASGPGDLVAVAHPPTSTSSRA
jgi:dihydroorotate dehydrogenase (NAD+) catalytic subunit